MKTLIENSPDAFNQEVLALKTIMKEKPNRYVTPLLVAMEHGTNRSLMFPWAEGNLLQFWNSNDNGIRQQPADLHLVRWMAKQFSGLASVITLVHGPTKPVSEDTTRSRNLQPVQTQYGRHGDLKPENILFFIGDEHDDDTDKDVPGGPRGILKVADFGLTAFHSKNSERQRASRTARSKTHRAPEFDGAEVTASADLWSFGCILLEFLVWYQRGMEGVDKFSRARSDEERVHNSEYTEDKFFMRATGAHPNFKVKEIVVKVSGASVFSLPDFFKRRVTDKFQGNRQPSTRIQVQRFQQ
jgi:serine/threonine protein kinase